jgi:hypothetical protein
LKCILENNVVEFNGKLYKQKIGTAMGSVPSPEVYDILMFGYINELVGLKYVFMSSLPLSANLLSLKI